MSYSNPNNAPIDLTCLIEPQLLSKIRQKAYPYDIHIDPSYKFQIVHTRLVERTKLRGIFMHRLLNMPF